MPINKPWESMRRCVLNMNGTVNYYLDSANSAFKADGTTPSDLTGTDGYVMVEIPKFYYKYERRGNVNIWKVKSEPTSGYAVHPAFVKANTEVNYRYVGAYDACLEFTRTITGVANGEGGVVTVSTSQQHPLYANDVVTISGTTDYNGTYTVLDRPNATTFNVSSTFVSSQTGTATGFVSGKNLDDVTAIIQTGVDKLASVANRYPLVGVTRPESRLLGRNPGTGWHQFDFALWSAIQMLYLSEYGNFNSQNRLGAGNTNGSYIGSDAIQNNSPHTIAGASNLWGNSSTNATQPSAGAKPGTAYMSYRGIENIFGNCWNWVDGINVNFVAAGNVHFTNNYLHFADATTNHTLIATTLPTASGFTKDILSGVGFGFLSSTNTGGSSTTFLTDQHFASTGLSRVVSVGGNASNGAAAGLFCVLSDIDAGLSSRRVGARVCF